MTCLKNTKSQNGQIYPEDTFTYSAAHICILTADFDLYSKTCLKRPLKKEDQLSLNAGQKYCRMEHSAILSTFIKLPFVNIKIFVLSF